MHYYTFNIGDYRRRTNHLTLLEHGIYRALLDSYYLTESPISSDINKTMRSHCVRTTEEKSALEYVLSEFFEKTDAGYVQKSCEEQILKFNEKSESARRSANARWNNANASINNAFASNTQCDGNANQQPITNNQQPITNNQVKEKKNCRPSADDTAKNIKLESNCKMIFDHWVKVMNKNSSTKFTPERKSKIKARLRDGYPIDQILSAINGCASSAWHMGKNENGKIYDDLTLICRDGSKLESFLTQQIKFEKPEEDFKTRMKRELGLGNTYEGETKNV